MTTQTATCVAAVIAASGAIIAGLIAKYDLLLLFKRSRLNLTGTWQGVSIYMPIDIFNVGSECIYRFSAEISQFGGTIRIKETIDEFFDIDGNRIDGHAVRVIEGKGKVLGDRDIIIQFREKDNLTCGTMYLTVNTWGKELQGMIAVSNPYFGTPAGVKVVLRRAGEKQLTYDDIGVRKVKAMAEAFLKENREQG